MRLDVLGALALLALAACDRESSATPTAFRNLKVTREIAAPDGGYDYASVDAAAGHVFVGRDDGVLRLDIASGKTMMILRRDGVAAVLLIPDSPLMMTTNSGSNTATLFNRVTSKVVSDIATGQEPDGAAYDTTSGLAFVMNVEDKTVTFIDVAKAEAVGMVAVNGVPEGAVAGPGGKLYVNIEDTNAIAVIDIATRTVVRTLPIKGCVEPTGIAYDPATKLLISACHNALTAFIDAATGAARGAIVSGHGADGSIFDDTHRIGYVPAIDGTLTIYTLDKQGRARVLQTLATREGARTAAVRFDNGVVYLPAAIVERDAEGKYVGATRNFAVIEASPQSH